MSDLIDSLRELASYYRWLDDAADELERLTKERDALKKALMQFASTDKPMLFDTTYPDTIERLTKDNEEHIRQINLRNDTIDGLRAELTALCNAVRKQTLLEAADVCREHEKFTFEAEKVLRRMAEGAE